MSCKAVQIGTNSDPSPPPSGHPLVYNVITLCSPDDPMWKTMNLPQKLCFQSTMRFQSSAEENLNLEN